MAALELDLPSRYPAVEQDLHLLSLQTKPQHLFASRLNPLHGHSRQRLQLLFALPGELSCPHRSEP